MVLPSPHHSLGRCRKVPSCPRKGLAALVCSESVVGPGARRHSAVSEGRRGSPVGGGAGGLRRGSAAASCRPAEAGRGAGSSAAAGLRAHPAGCRATVLPGRSRRASEWRQLGQVWPEIQETLCSNLFHLLWTSPGRAREKVLLRAESPERCRAPRPVSGRPSPPAAPPVYCVCAPVSGDLRLTPALCSLSSLSRCTVLSADFSVV